MYNQSCFPVRLKLHITQTKIFKIFIEKKKCMTLYYSRGIIFLQNFCAKMINTCISIKISQNIKTFQVNIFTVLTNASGVIQESSTQCTSSSANDTLA